MESSKRFLCHQKTVSNVCLEFSYLSISSLTDVACVCERTNLPRGVCSETQINSVDELLRATMAAAGVWPPACLKSCWEIRIE